MMADARGIIAGRAGVLSRFSSSISIRRISAMKPIYVFCHAPSVPLGSVERLPSRHGVELEVVRFYEPGDVRFDASAASGLIVLGGPMSASDTLRYPFLADEVRFMRQMMAANKPVLGICLGAQLMARALGARTYRNHTKEIGWHEVELLPAAEHDPLFGGLAGPMPVFQWHGDTFDLPLGVEHLARSALCEHQAFRFGNAWAVQFHAEITAEIIAQWLSAEEFAGDCAEIGARRVAEIRAQLEERLAPTAAAGMALFDRFADRVRQHARIADA